jgi:hypothetical protein
MRTVSKTVNPGSNPGSPVDRPPPRAGGAARVNDAAEVAPDPGDYRHHRGGEDNGDAHFKNLLVHHQVSQGPTGATASGAS